MSVIQARPRQAAQAIGWRQSKAMQERVTRWVVRVVLILIGITFMLPFYWLIVTSLKTNAQMSAYPPALIPNPIRWSNYSDAVTAIPFVQYLQNTLTITVTCIVGVVLSSSICAYGFARITWPGRNVLFLLMLATLMLPSQVTMIPLFVLFSKLHWVNTFLPLTIPAFFGDAFSIFLLRQFFMGIPHELSEAAFIDGANEWRIFTRIVLPLSKAALATVALTTFLANWSDFLGPLIYLNDSSKFTLAVALNAFIGEHASAWQQLNALAVLITLPPLVIFFFTQKTFIQGIALSGLKG